MVNQIVSSGGILLLAWGVLVVHELGHYLAGRRIVGIPADELRFVSPLFPRYVALRDGEQWVTPTDFADYRDAYAQFDPEFEHFERFVAGGDIIQTALLVPLSLAVAAAGFGSVAATILLVSLLATAGVVLADLCLTLYTGSPTGDYSGLASLDWKIPALLLLGVAFTHLTVLNAVT